MAKKRSQEEIQSMIDMFWNMPNTKLRLMAWHKENPRVQPPIFYIEDKDQVVWLTRKQRRQMNLRLTAPASSGRSRTGPATGNSSRGQNPATERARLEAQKLLAEVADEMANFPSIQDIKPNQGEPDEEAIPVPTAGIELKRDGQGEAEAELTTGQASNG